jgi:zinc/manganese transport system permease protein
VHLLFEPGFFSSQPVRTALVIGGVTAVVSAIVGVFTVVRSQSFAGHALTDVATAGGSGAFYFGFNALAGFIGGGIIGGGAMDLIGVQRVRSRDLATGIVLGAATGLAALFLYLDTTVSATTGATQQGRSSPSNHRPFRS